MKMYLPKDHKDKMKSKGMKSKAKKKKKHWNPCYLTCIKQIRNTLKGIINLIS